MTTPKACFTCMRGERFFDDCSHIDCPVRHEVTAQPVGTDIERSARQGITQGENQDGHQE